MVIGRMGDSGYSLELMNCFQNNTDIPVMSVAKGW